MKIVRVSEAGETYYGELKGDTVYKIEGELFGEFTVTDRAVPLANVKLLAPCTPSKVVAIGKNYMDHISEMAAMAAPELPEEPEVFLKPPSGIIAPGEEIVYPEGAKRVDYEAEIAVVIGKKARYVKKEEAGDYIFGLTLLNDVSRRDSARTTTQWVNGKGYDTFCPMGPYIDTEDVLGKKTIRSHLSGAQKQNCDTDSLIFSIPVLIEHLTNRMTLLPGDVIATGTPSGVGPMQAGDVIVVSSDELGELMNPVVAEVKPR
ncbi:MAG TPA: fumarylacetoacetate hydrolase family protein [Candidatus Acidoferrum sp.]|nr:fumarylacetoacetate hydrolase family protein [Candidatus Acidoferrum sp.]